MLKGIGRAAGIVGGALHDATVGSSDLSIRPYKAFLDDGRTIALLSPDVWGFRGRRLSMGPGFHPDFEEGNRMQGMTRAVKRWVGLYDTTGLKVSEDMILWAEALKGRGDEFKIILTRDWRVFKRARKGLLYQADLYAADMVELEKKGKSEESQERKKIVENFKKAANLVEHFIVQATAWTNVSIN